MGHLGVVLYEYLGEEYPEVLGSILGALKAIVNVIGTALVHEAPIYPSMHQNLMQLVTIVILNSNWKFCFEISPAYTLYMELFNFL